MSDTTQDQKNPSRRDFLKTAGALVGGLAIGGAAGAYAGSSYAASGNQAGGLKQGRGVLTIGNSVSTSGPTAPAISKAVDMLKSWETLINAQGGIYAPDMGGYIPVKVIVYPDGGPGDLGTVKNNYTRMATQDNVDIMIGPFAAALAETASPIAVQYSTPYVDTNAGEVPIFSQSGNWIVGEINLINFWLWNYFNVLKAQTPAKTIGLMDLGDDFGTEVNGTGASKFGAATIAKQLGFDVVTNGSDHINQNFSPNFDYSTEVQRMKSLDPDVIVFVETTGVFQGQFWLACKAAGYKPRAYHPIFATYSSFQSVVGADLANGLTGDIQWDSRFPFEGLWGKKFWASLETAANFKASEWNALPVIYSALETACAAVTFAGSTDKTKVAASLNSMEIMTLMGPWRAQNPLLSPFNPGSGSSLGKAMGLLIATPVQVINGQINILGTGPEATARYVYPQPTSW